MEVEFDTSALLAQLQAFEKEAVRRMEKMTEDFAYHLAKRAISNTPLGDSNAFMGYYQARTDLPQVEGIARGNWQYSKDSNFQLQLIYGIDSDIKASDKVAADAKSYKLGETFYIGNAAPYIGALEANHSIQTNGYGIMAPTIESIQGLYSFDFQNHYKRN